MSAHRYWRVLITAVQSGGYTSLSQVEMYEGAEPLNVCSGGTASASSTGFGWVPANAFDGSPSVGDGWHSGNNAIPTTPEWIAYDFGSGVTKDIKQIKLIARGDSNALSQAPKDFALQYSDDGSSYTTLFSVSGSIDWGSFFGTKTFDATGRTDPPPVGAGTTSRRAWRIKATAMDGGSVFSVPEMEMRVTVGGSDQTSGGSSFASSVAAGTTDSAFDNDTSNFWNSGSALPDSIGYFFATAKDLTEITITPRGSFVNQSPKDFTIDYWDVNHWVTAATVTGSTGWTNGVTRTFTFSPPAPTASSRPFVFFCT